MLRGNRLIDARFAGDRDVLVTVTSRSVLFTGRHGRRMRQRQGERRVPHFHGSEDPSADRHRADWQTVEHRTDPDFDRVHALAEPFHEVLAVAALQRGDEEDVVGGSELAVRSGKRHRQDSRLFGGRRPEARHPQRIVAAAGHGVGARRQHDLRSHIVHRQVRIPWGGIADERHDAEKLVQIRDVAGDDDDTRERRDLEGALDRFVVDAEQQSADADVGGLKGLHEPRQIDGWPWHRRRLQTRELHRGHRWRERRTRVRRHDHRKVDRDLPALESERRRESDRLIVRLIDHDPPVTDLVGRQGTRCRPATREFDR